MALEPITRKEKIIAGEDLTPITRMEKFLKEYGGGSGGGSNAVIIRSTQGAGSFPDEPFDYTECITYDKEAIVRIRNAVYAEEPVSVPVIWADRDGDDLNQMQATRFYAFPPDGTFEVCFPISSNKNFCLAFDDAGNIIQHYTI